MLPEERLRFYTLYSASVYTMRELAGMFGMTEKQGWLLVGLNPDRFDDLQAELIAHEQREVEQEEKARSERLERERREEIKRIEEREREAARIMVENARRERHARHPALRCLSCKKDVLPVGTASIVKLEARGTKPELPLLVQYKVELHAHCPDCSARIASWASERDIYVKCRVCMTSNFERKAAHRPTPAAFQTKAGAWCWGVRGKIGWVCRCGIVGERVFDIKSISRLERL
jgi:hypothetical protein